jgi:hypothetical protein
VDYGSLHDPVDCSLRRLHEHQGVLVQWRHFSRHDFNRPHSHLADLLAYHIGPDYIADSLAYHIGPDYIADLLAYHIGPDYIAHHRLANRLADHHFANMVAHRTAAKCRHGVPR